MEKGISLCMIVKNEENNIAICLNSVKEIVDEIIIVDTGSTDKTKELAEEICKNFNIQAKIFDFKWDDDFSSARNESLRHATKDWILVLDADETLDAEGVKAIRDIIKNKSADGYLLLQINYTNDTSVAGFLPSIGELSKGYKGFYVSLITRLFRNDKRYRFSGAVHELIEESIGKNKGKILTSNVQIHHYSSAGKKKMAYYLELAKKKVNENPSSSSYYEFGILLKENGYVNKSIEAFKNALKFDNHRMSLYELGVAYERDNDFDKAIEYLTRALRIKEDAEAFFSLGVCYLKNGMLKEAYRNLTKSLLLNPYKLSTYNNLGVVHQRNGNYEEAIKILELGMKICPNAIGAYNFGVVYDKIGNEQKAIESYQRAISLGYKNSEKIKKRIEELKEISANKPSYRFSFS